MKIQEAFFLWLEALGQLYMEDTAVPGVIADTVIGWAITAGSCCRNREQRDGLSLRPRKPHITALSVTTVLRVSKIFIAQFCLYFHVNKENPTEKLKTSQMKL